MLNSLERRQRFLAGAERLPRQLALFDREEDPLDDEEPGEILAPPGMHDGDLERRWLAVLIDAAASAAQLDSKLAFLRRLVRRLRGDSAIVFTEYRDTLAHLSASFQDATLLHGGSSADERDEVRRRFNAEGGLLIATDAAAEGLNLQGRCRLVINYELPWNPARLEQRIGRVDRIGQERAVHAVTLVARDTAEHLVLARLTRRLHRDRRDPRRTRSADGVPGRGARGWNGHRRGASRRGAGAGSAYRHPARSRATGPSEAAEASRIAQIPQLLLARAGTSWQPRSTQGLT